MNVLTSENYDTTIREGISMIDFFAEWCGPCHALSPILDDIATKYEGRVKTFKVDVDASPQIAARYQIMSIPTIIFFKNGQIINTIVGAQPVSRYTDILDEMLKQA
jgi:thioredoxin 1